MKVTSLAALLLSSGVIAQELHNVALHSNTADDLMEFARTHNYDFGCRPVAIPTESGFQMHAFVTTEQYSEIKAYRGSAIRFNLVANKRAATAPIGTGDRFSAGTIAPQGLGTRSTGESTNLGGILNVNEVNSAIKGLATVYGVTTYTAPYKTFEGASSTVGLVGGRSGQYAIYFTAGIHARERGGPDNLIYFISDLLYAQKAGTGLKYGSRTYTNAQVSTVLNAGIVFFPLTNPDGVKYDQSSGSSWRKNRNTAKATSGVPASIGVDLNRNFDFLWNFKKYFAPSAVGSSLASENPSDSTYHGTAPFSEPETKNIASVLDKYTSIKWFLDIHSAAGTILYSWGDDNDQTSTPTQSFTNAAFDGKCGILNDKTYLEYITATDLSNVQTVASRTVSAMKAVGGRSYINQQSVGLYPTSGASDDYALSRHYGNSSKTLTRGFTMEFGYSTNFYPTTAEYNQNILDTNAGFMDFSLAAAGIDI